MTRLASALLVAKRVLNLGIMAWCVALEGRAHRATMPCVTQSLTRELQLALPLSKRKGPYSQAITGGLPIFSSITGGKDAALDVTITHPLKSDTRAGAALTPGHAASVTFENKMRGAAELCRAEGLAFVPRLCAASPLIIHFSHLPLY